MLAAAVPLLAILALDFWLVRAAYDLLKRFLPDALSPYLVANSVGLLAPLLALTYGAIPFLGARQAPAFHPRAPDGELASSGIAARIAPRRSAARPRHSGG